MIRVCHLITGLDVGGAENTLVRICHALADHGYHQLVITMVPGGHLAGDLQRAGITVRSLDMRRGWPNPFSYIRLVRELRRFRADVLQTWMYHADLLGTLVRPFLSQVCLVWNLRCSDMRGDRRGSLKWLVNSLALLSGIPQAIIVNSRSGWADHVHAGYRQSRCVLIPNDVDTDRFRPLPEERAALRKALGLPLEATLIGLIARVHPMKDHGTFLTAAGQFRASHPDAHFVLVLTGVRAGCGTARDHDPGTRARFAYQPAWFALRSAAHLSGARSGLPVVGIRRGHAERAVGSARMRLALRGHRRRRLSLGYRAVWAGGAAARARGPGRGVGRGAAPGSRGRGARLRSLVLCRLDRCDRLRHALSQSAAERGPPR